MSFRLFAPPTLEKMISKKDIKGIKALLIKTFPSEECIAALKALEELGYIPEFDEAGAIIALLKRDFSQIDAIGEPAVSPLVSLLKNKKIKEESFRVVHQVDENGELGGDSYEMVDTIRKDARKALLDIGPAAVPELLRILDNEGEDLGYAFEPVLSILIEINDPRAADGFLTLLKKRPKIDVYGSSVFWSILPFAARQYKDKRLIPYCVRILSERNLNSMVRRDLETTLKELGQTPSK